MGFCTANFTFAAKNCTNYTHKKLIAGIIVDQFKKITLEDKDILAHYLGMSRHRACDYSAGNLICWSDVYQTHYAVSGDMLFIKYNVGSDVYFAFPLGSGDLREAFAFLENYCAEQGLPFQLNLVEPEMFARVEQVFPGKFDIAYNRDLADYVYNTEDLKNLSGKKYHGKKNHVNQFIRANPDWAYEAITDENTEQCIEMARQWCRDNGCCADQEKADELCVLIKALRLRAQLGLIGGLIRVGGKIVALTLGEKSGEDMYIVHFEKAFSAVSGAYPMINQQFVLHELAASAYINREEDVGSEGLRKSKESYYPAFMVEKGILLRKNTY